jgi:hypothetical protein
MLVVAGVDVNPGALRTSFRDFPEAEAMAGSLRSGTTRDRRPARGIVRDADL